MKTVKIKFAGKWEGFTPEASLIYYWLKKCGYDVQVTEDADYVVCDVFGKRPMNTASIPRFEFSNAVKM